MGATRGQAEEVSHFSCSDVLESGRMVWYWANPQGESRLLVQEEGSSGYVQHGNYGAEIGVVGVTKERDFLTVLFVFLHPPANADGGYV